MDWSSNSLMSLIGRLFYFLVDFLSVVCQSIYCVVMTFSLKKINFECFHVFCFSFFKKKWFHVLVFWIHAISYLSKNINLKYSLPCIVSISSDLMFSVVLIYVKLETFLRCLVFLGCLFIFEKEALESQLKALNVDSWWDNWVTGWTLSLGTPIVGINGIVFFFPSKVFSSLDPLTWFQFFSTLTLHKVQNLSVSVSPELIFLFPTWVGKATQ